MHWRPFYALLVALALLTLPMTLWSMEIFESELTALTATFDELRTLNQELQSKLQTAERLQNEAQDSLLAADQSFRAYERAVAEALRATRAELDQARAEADLTRLLGILAALLAAAGGFALGHAWP